MYKSGSKAAAKLGIHQNTLRRWANEGKVSCIRTKGGQRRYDTDTLIAGEPKRRNFCYCRVSSYKQRDDLERQVEFMRRRYPIHEIVTDIGSGINFKRKGLRAILELADRGEVGEVVVAHRDRLCRFGFELLEWFIAKHNGKVVVLGEVHLSPESELTNDLLSIIHVFSCRMHGLRKYSSEIKKDKDLSGRQAERDSEKVDGDSAVCVQPDNSVSETTGN